MVSPESVAVVLPLTVKTVKLSLPLMVTPALGPVIVIGAKVADVEPPSVRVPPVSVIVFDEANTPRSKVIGCAIVVVSASARLSAWRSVSRPGLSAPAVSAVVLTTRLDRYW